MELIQFLGPDVKMIYRSFCFPNVGVFQTYIVIYFKLMFQKQSKVYSVFRRIKPLVIKRFKKVQVGKCWEKA